MPLLQSSESRRKSFSIDMPPRWGLRTGPYMKLAILILNMFNFRGMLYLHQR